MDKVLDVRKPTTYGNTVYMLMSGILDKDKFYKIMRVGKKILIEEADF